MIDDFKKFFGIFYDKSLSLLITHAKISGLWYYSSSFPNYPLATLIGSPNYGYRSVEKDLEAQVTIVSKNKYLQKALHNEHMRLQESSAKVMDETFFKPERVVPRWVKLIVGTCRRFF